MQIQKLKYTQGCTCYSLDVDGKEFNIDLTLDERKEVCIYLINENKGKCKFFLKVFGFFVLENDNIDWPLIVDEDGYIINYDLSDDEAKQLALRLINEIDDSMSDWPLQEIFCTFLESFGKYKYLGHCDCCGDSITEHTYEL